MLLEPAPVPDPVEANAQLPDHLRTRRVGNAWMLLAAQVLVTLGPAAHRAPGFSVYMDGEGFIFAVPRGADAPLLPPGARLVIELGDTVGLLDFARELARSMSTPRAAAQPRDEE